MKRAYRTSNEQGPLSRTDEDSAIGMASSSNEENIAIHVPVALNAPPHQSQRNTESTTSQGENLFEQLFVTAREPLGSGGQGTVHECTERFLGAYRYRENGGTFAVKIINTDGLAEEKIARLQTELELLNQINGEAHILSTQIVPVFHAYEVVNCSYMLMERMVGGPSLVGVPEENLVGFPSPTREGYAGVYFVISAALPIEISSHVTYGSFGPTRGPYITVLSQ